MKRKLTKIACLAMAAVVSLSFFTGCGEDKKNGAGKPYEIVWYFPSTSVTTDVASVETEINKYLTEKINATLKLMPLDWGAYETKMNPIVAGRQKFDLCFSANWLFSYAQNAKRGAFAPLDEHIKKVGTAIEQELGADNLNLMKVNDKIYGVPVMKDHASNYGFIYRKDLVDKYNIDIQNIKSYEDLIPALDIIKKNEPDVIPLYLARGKSPATLLNYEHIAFPNALHRENNIGKVVNILEQPDYIEALELSRKIYTAGYTPKGGALGSNYNKMIKEGQIFATLETLKPGKADELSTGSYKYVQVDVTTPLKDTGSIQGAVTCVGATSENPQKVTEFLNLLYTDAKLNNLIVFGVEGKHYTKISDNVIKPIDGSGYGFVGSQWMFGNTFLQYILENEDPQKAQKTKDFNKSAKITPYMDLQIVNDSYKTELAACGNVREEFEANLEGGMVDVATTLTTYQKKMKEANSDKIKDEVQKQVDTQMKK